MNFKMETKASWQGVKFENMNEGFVRTYESSGLSLILGPLFCYVLPLVAKILYPHKNNVQLPPILQTAS